MPNRPCCRRSTGIVAAAAVVGGLAGAAGLLLLTGVGIRRPESFAAPTESAEEAWRRFEVDRQQEGIVEEGRSRLLQPVEPVAGTPTIVLMHGLTMTPEQFTWIGEVLCSLGYRVLLPRMPDHGRIDRSPALLGHHTAEDLTAFADEAIDVAAGFGGPVWVLGLSAGGLLASWCAAVRPEVTRVVAVAPFTAPAGYPWAAVRATARFGNLLPLKMHWWDVKRREEGAISPYGYAGFPMRGASGYMHVSEALYDNRLPAQPNLERAVLVINEGDRAVSAPRARELFRSAFRDRVEDYEEVTLPLDWGWTHEVIDSWVNPRPDPRAVLSVLFAGLGLHGPEVDAAIDAYETVPRYEGQRIQAGVYEAQWEAAAGIEV